MADYTICPKFIEFSGSNKNYILDILMPFVSDNSNRLCVDSDEKILSEYNKSIKNNKDLLDWYGFLTMRKELNIVKIDSIVSHNNLPIDICKNSYDKLLISNQKSDYSSKKQEIKENNINLLDKNLAKIHINYGDISYPINTINSELIVTIENVYDIVKEICNEYKDLIENKGLFKLLVDKEEIRVKEKDAQLLFFGVAHFYCSANDLKLSPEVNSGNGPVDFNLSKGFKANVNVEMKIADSNKLEKGLWSQLNIYNKAENTNKSIYLIIKTNDEYDKKIKKLEKILNYRKSKGEVLPDIVVVDSSFKQSASVR
ncbi:hypothetical protein [Tenacibaculum piscium]|uniref:hypothetical protein n=1 Tax=Tenacibaculum piscium TaxID=1458515 RepID=UPI001F311B82|nr:hypothetical protein [Tenacibaculum piscium]